MIRDFLVHRVLPPYELGEIRLRSETIVQRPWPAVSAEHLLRTVKVDEPAAVTLEDDALSRIHALMMSLEFLGHLRYGGFLYGKEQGPGEVSGGSKEYMQEIDNRRRETPGLQWIVNVDRKFRKKVYELQTEQKDRCPTYSAALSVAMKEHSLYWAESRMEVLTGTATAPRPVTVDAPARTPTSTQLALEDVSTRDRKRQAQKDKRERAKARKVESKPEVVVVRLRDAPGAAVARPNKVPEDEWKKFHALGPAARKNTCKWWNMTTGCHVANCRFEEICWVCGEKHRWCDRHMR